MGGGNYRTYIGNISYWDYMGITEKNMETIIVFYNGRLLVASTLPRDYMSTVALAGFRVYVCLWFLLLLLFLVLFLLVAITVTTKKILYPRPQALHLVHCADLLCDLSTAASRPQVSAPAGFLILLLALIVPSPM